MTRIYTEHNPAKIGEIDGLLLKWKGKEGDILTALRKKYGVEEGGEGREGNRRLTTSISTATVEAGAAGARAEAVAAEMRGKHDEGFLVLEYFERQLRSILQADALLRDRTIMVWSDALLASGQGDAITDCCIRPSDTIVETEVAAATGKDGAGAAGAARQPVGESLADIGGRGYRVVVGSRVGLDGSDGGGLSLDAAAQSWEDVYGVDIFASRGRDSSDKDAEAEAALLAAMKPLVLGAEAACWGRCLSQLQFPWLQLIAVSERLWSPAKTTASANKPHVKARLKKVRAWLERAGFKMEEA
jgi:hypothetical protein